jgi:hypothetical protein
MRITDIPGMTASHVRAPDQIERLRRFQTERYLETGLITVDPDDIGPDPHAHRSLWFAVYGPDGSIWATSRFIGAENHELPLFNDFVIDPEYRHVLTAFDDQVSEVSRLAIAPAAPSVATLAMLVREMVRFAVANGRHTVLVGAVERPMVQVIRRVLKMPCVVIGPLLRNYYNTDNYPVMIDGVRWLADLRFRDPEYWRFFADDLVLHPNLLREAMPSVPAPTAMPSAGAPIIDLTLSA